VTQPVTSITEANAVVKTPASSVYSELIIPDFQYAGEHLPAVWSGENTGRATKFSAFGFLGKVYLTLGRYQEAQAALGEVIARSPEQFDLWDDYGDAFRIENNNGKESVFSITHSNTSLFWEAGQFNVRWLPIELDKNSLEWELPTENLYNAFDSLDRRKEITFITSVDDVPIDPHISKYWSSDEEPDASSTANDYQLLRYADILLMYAEAENELNGPTPVAHNFVNEVRRRARYHADDNTTYEVLPDLSGLTQEQLRDAILMERKREFAFEGQRWYDLVRADRLVEKVSEAKPEANVQEHHTLFPIPQRVINISTEEIVQNTGY
jgi:tetratricopeptide (TPR) repeat protein